MKRHLLILGTTLSLSVVAFAVDRPSNPSFLGFSSYNSSLGYGDVTLSLSSKSTEGNDLDPESLYYNVFHDDNIFTYMPGGKYAMVREEMTDVPYTYSDGMDFNVHPSYLMHQLKFYEDDFSKFGVQLCHKDGDTVTKSDIIYSDGSSVAWEEEGDKEPLPGSETIISEQPEGTLYDNLYRSSESCSTWGSTQNDGKLGKMVIDDSGNFYIYSPVDGVNAWIKGEQADDGTVVVKLPQAVYSYAYDDVEYVYYIWSMKKEGGLYVPDTDNPDITFTWSDNTLTMTGENILGYGDATGYYQMGESALTLKVLPYAPLTEIPAGATTSEWKMDYDGQVAGNPSSTVVTVGIDGSDIYVKGLGGLPESWVKGTFDGTTAVFESDQYLGIDEDKNGHSYFTGGRKEITTDPIGGYDVTDFYRTKDVKFTFDATSNTFRTDSVVLVGVGINTNHFDYYYDHPVLTAYVENGGIPANPSFSYFYPYSTSSYYGNTEFTLPMVNTEGQELNPAKLYYNVYHDDEVFTFTSDGYGNLSGDMTDIPYSFTNGFDFIVNGEKHTIYFYESDFEKFGVQLCYKRGETVTKSDIVYHDGTIVEYENPKVLPGKETIIAEQPEGTLYENLYRSSVGYSSWSVSQNDGELGKMVIDDNGNFYIYSPVAGVDAWIKGEQTEEGTVVVKLPQAVSETTDYEGNPQVNYVWSMKSDAGSYVTDTDNPDITFTWSDNTLTMTGTNVFGLGDAEGMYQMGEGSLMLKVLPYSPLTEIPADATISEWKMDYDGQVANNPSSIVVTVGIDGSDIYVKGLGGLPESWVKGTFDGTTAVFESDQYLGIDEDKNGHSYFTGGRKEITTDPIGGYDVTDFYRTKDVKFTFDATSNTFRTDSVVLVGVGINTNHFNYYYDHPVLSAYVENGGTPANPSFSSFTPVGSYGYGCTEFTLPMVNTEGQELNPAKLYYNVYHDGNVFTFKPDQYAYLYNEMTDIPYTFTNGFDFIVNGEKHTIYFYESDFEKFGVQLCYKNGDTVTKSDIVYHDGSTVGGAVSTSNMAEKTVVGSIYTDILGRRISQLVEGTFYIRTDIYDDGSRSTVKVRYGK